MANKTTVSKFLEEKINFGGRLMARGSVFNRMIAAGYDRQKADYFAHSGEAAPREEQEAFRAVCDCGARWLGVIEVQLMSCPDCRAEGR